jgi:hypothetical protein
MSVMFEKTVWIALALCLLGVVSVSSASADTRSGQPILAFDQSVAVPGTVLPAGAYTIVAVTPKRKVVGLSAPIQTPPVSDGRTPAVAVPTTGTSQPELPAATRPVPLITLVGFISLGIAIVLVLFRDHAEARPRRSTHNDRSLDRTETLTKEKTWQ